MLLKIEDISKAYGTPGEAGYHPVLNALSLELSAGATLAILGPSGSGKSTLLNILGTLDLPDSGTYMYRDRDITAYSGAELDHFRNQEIGFVFQFHHLLPQCTVLENVLIPTLMNKKEVDEKKAYAETLLGKVGMLEHAQKLPGQLSGGECQRVAVVRAMINRPSLLLADEPTGALDKKNVGRMTDLLLQMSGEEGAALVLVTHSDALAAGMETILHLDEGKLKKQ
jgi:ABC-type lipoprotein export system ATPase subunit